MKIKHFKCLLCVALCAILSLIFFTACAGKDGKDGKKGMNGENGKSAYELALENGYQGTLEEWLVSIKGEHGEVPSVKDGYWWVDGENTGVLASGKDGLSAYELYLKQNSDYKGSEDQWIADLVSGNLTNHKITFDLNGGSPANGFESTVNAKYGKTISLTVPSKEGYTFLGWYTGDSAVDGVFTTTDIVTGDLSLIARWQINTLKVTFLDYYGDILSLQNVNYGSSATAPSIPLEVNSLPFTGWSCDFDCVTEDLTVKALYSRKVYTVTYNTDGGTNIQSDSLYHGDIPKKPADPIKAGHSFKGWYLDASFKNEYKFDYAFDKNTVLYAKFVADHKVITSAAELMQIASNPSGKYVLANDINLRNDIWTPIESFSGVLDGAGYKIYNFVVSGTADSLGFIKTNDGTVKNIVFDSFAFTYVNDFTAGSHAYAGVIAAINNGEITNCELRSGDITMSALRTQPGTINAYFGSFVAINYGTLSHCTSNVVSKMTSSCVMNTTYSSGVLNSYIGGAAGCNYGNILRVTVNANMPWTAESSTMHWNGLNNSTYGTANVFMGGIVGQNNANTQISQCTVKSDIDITYSGIQDRGHLAKNLTLGGIVGNNLASIDDCAFYGSLKVSNTGFTLNSKIGGAVGFNNPDCSLSCVYADADITVSSLVIGSVGGLAGDNGNGASILKSIYMGSIEAGENMTSYGFIAGINTGTAHLAYYDKSQKLTLNNTSVTPICINGIGESSSKMLTRDFIYDYLYWSMDFWNITDGNKPIL